MSSRKPYVSKTVNPVKPFQTVIPEVEIDPFCNVDEKDKLNRSGKNGCWKEFEAQWNAKHDQRIVTILNRRNNVYKNVRDDTQNVQNGLQLSTFLF